MTVSVLVADDERLIRAGLRATLETTPDIRVVADGETAPRPSTARGSCALTSC